MADLSAMYMDLAESTRNSTQRGILGMQQMMDNQLAYQKAREDLEAQRGLRALFAQNPNASSEEVSRYSPQFGMEMNKYALEQQERSGRMQKTKREISEMEAKAVAETLGPIAERAKVTGDLNQYKIDIGKAASALAQQGIPLPMNFDPETHTPDAVLMNSVGRGYKSPWLESQYAVQQKRAPNFGEAEGTVSRNPVTGAPEWMPPVSGARQPSGTGMGGAAPAQIPNGFQPATAEDLPALEQEYNNATDVNQKQMIGALINQLRQQTSQLPVARGVTPEEKGEYTKQEKKGTLAAEKEAALEQRNEVLSSIPDRATIEGLIDKSIGSGLEQQVKGKLGPMVGQSSEALEATKQLEVIAPQLKSITKSLAGAGAITDFEQKMMADAAGAISDPNMPPEARKAAFRTFMDVMDKANKGKEKSGGLPRPKTPAEAKALPPGTRFIDPDGNERIN